MGAARVAAVDRVQDVPCVRALRPHLRCRSTCRCVGCPGFVRNPLEDLPQHLRHSGHRLFGGGQFEKDGSIGSNLLKTVKRGMAGA